MREGFLLAWRFCSGAGQRSGSSWASTSEVVVLMSIYRFDGSGAVPSELEAISREAPMVPRVLLVHGQPGSGSLWGHLPRALGGLGEIYSYDRPGWGQKSGEAGGLGHNVEYLDAVLQCFGDDPPVLLGYSYGAAVVLDWIAERQPRGVRALLVAPAANLLALGALDRLFEVELVGSVISALASGTLRHAARGSLTQKLHHARSLLIESMTLLDDLGRVRFALPDDARVAVLSGLLDRVVPPRAVVALAQGLQVREISWCAQAGHLIVWTHPGAVAAALGGLLGSRG